MKRLWWFLNRKRRQREYERESFHARLVMENHEQERTAARLKALELRAKNELRIK